MTWERAGLVVGGLVCLVVTPWFALAFFPAYGASGEVPPPWAEWIDWPTLISGSTAVDTYNRYGVIFGVSLVVVALSLAVLARRSTDSGSGVRRSWNVIAAGLGAVAVGSLVEYGFGSVVDASYGFLIENLGFVVVIVGTVLLGVSLRREAGASRPVSAAIAASGLVGIIIGILLVGHLPSGAAFVPPIACVVFGFTGLPTPNTTRTSEPLPPRP